MKIDWPTESGRRGAMLTALIDALDHYLGSESPEREDMLRGTLEYVRGQREVMDRAKAEEVRT